MLLVGKYVTLRTVRVDDAKFILSLRCDPVKSKYLNKTEYNLEKQEVYIQNALLKNDEYYFIIENNENTRIGTYRIYDLRKDSFCIGSWIMIDDVVLHEVMEADYLVRKFGFEELGFEKCHFDVRKNNSKVLSYHKLVGAVQIDENDLDYFFECTKHDYYSKISKFFIE